MASDGVPSKRELHQMIKVHAWLMVALLLGGFAIVSVLIKKGVLTASDFRELMAE